MKDLVLTNSDWREASLGEILPLKYGKARCEQFGYLRPMTSTFGSNGAFGTFKRALTEKSAIIIGRKGAAGTVHFSPEPCWPIDTAYYTEGSERTYLPFFRYLLESLQLVRLDRSTAIPSLSRDDYNSKTVRYPVGLEAQRHIVAEIEKQFTRLDTGVAALKRTQANLKRYRASVLKAACEGRLVPTEAELARQERRPYETGEQLLARILADRRKNWTGRGKYKEPVTFENSAIPSIPDGWTWSNVEQLTSLVTSGSRGWGDFYSDVGPLFIRAQDIKTDSLKIANVARVAIPDRAEGTRSLVESNDLLVTITGANVTKSAIVLELNESAFVSQHIALLKPVYRETSPFLYLWIISPAYGRKYLEQWAYGAGKPGLNLEQVRSLAIPLPPLAEQTRIVAEVERRLSVVDELEAAVSANLLRAARLRQSILQKAFLGQLVAQEPVEEFRLEAEPVPVRKPKPHFARAVLSAEIVHQLHDEPTFGRVKHQKILHLCEHIAKIGELQGKYSRKAAGPLDNKLIYANEDELKKQRWYQTVARPVVGHAYQPMANAGQHQKYLRRFTPDMRATISRLIELMRGWDTQRCEIFSTAYAAWNDLILWSKPVTDDAILHEILHRWNDSKQLIAEDRWRKAIGWIRKEGFEPTGFGKPTTTPG